MKSYQALFQPQWYETRNWLQEENWKKKKASQICGLEQHATEQPRIKEQIKRNIKKYLKNQRKGQQYHKTKIKRHSDQNLLNATKGILRGKFIAINVYI